MPRSAASASACSSAPAAASNWMSSAPTGSGVAGTASVCPPASPRASWAAHCATAWCSCRPPPARSRRTATSLVPLGGTAHPIGLTGAVYRFVTPSIVADAEGNLARLDRRALTVSREVTDAPGGWLTPFAGGVAVGLGSLLYDSRLALVAAHPSVPAAASAPVASGARLYALTLRCTGSGPRRWRDRCRCADRICRCAPQRSVRHRAARRPRRQACRGRLRLTRSANTTARVSRSADRLRSPGEGPRQARPTTPGDHR